MAVSLLYPNLASSSLKDAVIGVLLDESSLTAKEIYARILKTKKVSYQAVFKVLKQMCENRILIKEGNKYKVSPDWIKQLKTFADMLDQRFKIAKTDPSTESKMIEFDTYYSFTENMLNIFASRILIERGGSNYGIGVLKHLWWALNFENQNFEKFKVMGKSYDSYVICPGNTVVDQWLKDYYIKAGFREILLGADYKMENDFAVIGNYIVNIFYDPEIEKMIDHFYSTGKDISELIQKGFMDEIFSKKTHIKVIMIRDPELAKTLREKLMGYLKIEKNH